MSSFATLGELSPYLENPWNQFLAIFAVSLILTVIVRWILRFLLSSFIRRTETELDDILIKSIKRLVTYTIPLVGLMIALTPLALGTPVPQRVLFSLLSLLLLRSAVGLVGDLSDWLEKAWVDRTESTLDDGLLPLLRKATKTVLVILVTLLVLGQWEVEVGPLLGALGIGGLAVGLALNSSLSNIFGGIQLILDGSLNVGDKITLETGETGVVMDVGLRSTKMRTYENEVLYVPNSALSDARVKNYTQPDASIRATVDFGVAYGSDVARTRQIVLDAISKLDDIMEEPAPQVIFLSMSDFSLDMSARVWVDDYDNQFGKKLEMTELVYNTLVENNIEIPFPTQTVHMKP